MGGGDEAAGQELLELVYEELRRRAASYLRAERLDHTLQPTALVHEAWMRMVRQDEVPSGSRAQFTAAAANAMRRILVDWARGKGSLKRQRGQRVKLETAAQDLTQGGADLLDVDVGVKALSLRSPRLAQLVELRYFAGLTMEEVAETLEVSLSTAERDWRVARAFLSNHLRGAG